MLAQKRGVERAGRLVSSAKSWLSTAEWTGPLALLPASAHEGNSKVSPVEASATLSGTHSPGVAKQDAGQPVHQAGSAVTVPASFDAVHGT